jgi:hypothetical protein
MLFLQSTPDKANISSEKSSKKGETYIKYNKGETVTSLSNIFRN